MTKERLKMENKYKKKLNKVMETFIERVDNPSSSGSCSSDEKNLKSSKKRKFHDFISNLNK